MPSKDDPVKINVLKTLEKGRNKSTLCNCFEVLSKFSGVLLCGSDSLTTDHMVKKLSHKAGVCSAPSELTVAG